MVRLSGRSGTKPFFLIRRGRMEDAVSNNAALMRCIEQLEHERDELQHDIEQLCMQQSGVSGSVDILSRMQNRRAAGLEQELEACKQKLAIYTRENHILQEELSEVYRIKSQFADLLKVESEKSIELEKEVKFFQGRVAAALAERDRAILEAEKNRKKEHEMMDKMNQLRDRIEQITSDSLEQENFCKSMQENLERMNSECTLYQKVVQMFWHGRENVARSVGVERIQDKACILLQDSENCWSYGETNKALKDAQAQAEKAEATLAMVQEEFQASKTSVASLQKQLGEEYASQLLAEEKNLHYKKQVLHLAEFAQKEFRQLQSAKASLREAVAACLGEELKWFNSVFENWQHRLEDARTCVASSSLADKYKEESLEMLDNSERELMGIKEHVDIPEISCSETSTEKSQVLYSALRENDQLLAMDDSKEALAQALREKVAALLLLSQQEERHLLEKNTTVALESQISNLKQQVTKATREKLDALIELSQLRQQCTKLQERERELMKMLQQHHGTSASGRLLPASWTDVALLENEKSVIYEKESRSMVSSGGYLKNWLRGFELPRSKSSTLFHGFSATRNASSKEDEAFGIARLRVENASLQESLSSIRHLCKSASRLRLTIAKVATESSTLTRFSLHNAMEALDSVIAEVRHLKVALGTSLPVSFSGSNNVDSPTSASIEIMPEGLTNAKGNEEIDIVSAFGMEVVGLILLAAELLKTLLSRNSDTKPM